MIGVRLIDVYHMTMWNERFIEQGAFLFLIEISDPLHMVFLDLNISDLF